VVSIETRRGRATGAARAAAGALRDTAIEARSGKAVGLQNPSDEDLLLWLFQAAA
jgi:hypothetical protein